MQRDCTDVILALTECYINVTEEYLFITRGIKEELKRYD